MITRKDYDERRTKMSEENKLITYRLDQLEKNVVTKVDAMNDMLTRLTTKLDAGAFSTMNCPMHAKRLSDIEASNQNLVTEVDKLKSWKYKVAGALIVITFILNLFSGPISDKLFGRTDSTTIEFVDK